MSFARDTFHLEISPLNDVAPMNIALISVTLDTSHSSIDPRTPSEQSIPWSNFRLVVMALLSSALDCGENRTRPAQDFGEMEISRAKKMT